MDRWSTEDFYGSETILYNTAMVDASPYTFVKIHIMHNTKSKPCCALWSLDGNGMSVQAP